ncbi:MULTISPECIES: hypothetical protein [unclassified Caballeronia]|uniref:hypothetical protein n=1 Tax=unclassified Caballeronia TaxID=2646786 RepID=UPI002858F472|nr:MULTISPECIES: hypothetical protein [unclassified Caballeronia]MDR5737836.1 hypothetical protein [Caballeronia sp. LZ016]MDR5809628.1 hypothetical protein [Caballeronia sp. LZ019]
MSKRLRATIVFYDEDTQQLQLCNVRRDDVQSAIERAGFVFDVPTDAPDNRSAPVTDEHARQIGGMALLVQAHVHPELRTRLHLTLNEPIDWEQRPEPPNAAS